MPPRKVVSLHFITIRGVPDKNPVRYQAGSQENVLSGIRPDFSQCPAGYYLKILILDHVIYSPQTAAAGGGWLLMKQKVQIPLCRHRLR